MGLDKLKITDITFNTYQVNTTPNTTTNSTFADDIAKIINVTNNLTSNDEKASASGQDIMINVNS